MVDYFAQFDSKAVDIAVVDFDIETVYSGMAFVNIEVVVDFAVAELQLRVLEGI